MLGNALKEQLGFPPLSPTLPQHHCSADESKLWEPTMWENPAGFSGPRHLDSLTPGSQLTEGPVGARRLGKAFEGTSAKLCPS